MSARNASEVSLNPVASPRSTEMSFARHSAISICSRAAASASNAPSTRTTVFSNFAAVSMRLDLRRPGCAPVPRVVSGRGADMHTRRQNACADPTLRGRSARGDRREQDHRIPHGGRAQGIGVGVALIRPERDDVARLEQPFLPGDYQLDAAGLAGQIFASAGRVRNARQPGEWGKFHPGDLGAGDRIWQQLPDHHIGARAFRERAPGMESGCGAGRREELFQGHLQRGGDAVQHPQGGIGAPRLEVRPGRPRQTRHARHLLLRHAAGAAELPDVGRQVAGQGIDGHANRVAFCQPIVTGANPEACRVRLSTMDLKGRGALITGASKGLGAALAAELARAGARVALVARGVEELESVAARIRAEGGDAHALAADVADKRALHGIAGAAAAVVGPIEILVHNASTLGPTPLRLLLDTECEDLARVLEANLVGPFRLTRIIAGAMALHGSGVAVHVSSDAAIAAYPRWGGYGVSKAALDHLNRSWAAELPQVRFFSVDPGVMDTAIHAAAMPDADRTRLARAEDVARRLARMIAECARLPNRARVVVPPCSRRARPA